MASSATSSPAVVVWDDAAADVGDSSGDASADRAAAVHYTAPAAANGTADASSGGQSVAGLHFHPNLPDAAGWEARDFDAELAHVLCEHSVALEDVSPRAPKRLVDVALAVSELGQPFGRASMSVLASVTLALRARAQVLSLLPSPPVGTGLSRQRAAASSGSHDSCRVPSSGSPALVSADSPAPTAPVVIRAKDVEREGRLAQMRLLLEVLPLYAQWHMHGSNADEWAGLSLERHAVLHERHLCSFSAGSLSHCRRAISRLRIWLRDGDMREAAEQLKCSGCLLSLWVLDERAISRSSGESVMVSLRAGVTFGFRHCGLQYLGVSADSFCNIAVKGPATPRPARATPPDHFFQFMYFAVRGPTAAEREYGAGFALACIAALRVRDGQRARIGHALVTGASVPFVTGSCYTSKHPKRRTAMPMPFFAVAFGPWGEWWVPLLHPARDKSLELDYVFRAAPRARLASLSSCTGLVCSPASSANIIKAMRWMLQQPPLKLSASEAASYSGHSPRHFLPTLARLLAFPLEDRNEIARWAASEDTRGRRAAMPNAYASEAEADRILDIQQRLFKGLFDLVSGRWPEVGVLPLQGGWDAVRDALSRAGRLSGVQRDLSTELEAEVSSSESDDD